MEMLEKLFQKLKDVKFPLGPKKPYLYQYADVQEFKYATKKYEKEMKVYWEQRDAASLEYNKVQEEIKNLILSETGADKLKNSEQIWEFAYKNAEYDYYYTITFIEDLIKIIKNAY